MTLVLVQPGRILRQNWTVEPTGVLEYVIPNNWFGGADKARMLGSLASGFPGFIREKLVRFPPEIIQHGIWLYLRFTLSYRDVEELLAERGLGTAGHRRESLDAPRDPPHDP
jgi:hypothetical protein